jgi:hypothetical protein
MIMSDRPISFEDAKRLFVHRYTVEHIPDWAKEPYQHSELGEVYYAPQYATDREWYDRTEFYGEGVMATEDHCYSGGETWPLGKGFLREPFHHNADQRTV